MYLKIKKEKIQIREFQDEADLDSLADNPNELVLQSILVIERVLGIDHQYTSSHVKEWFVFALVFCQLMTT